MKPWKADVRPRLIGQSEVGGITKAALNPSTSQITQYAQTMDRVTNWY